MTKENVISILGDPFSKINVAKQEDLHELLLYTDDGGCSWSDFAWKRKEVYFKNGIVVKANTGWAYD